MVFTPKAQGSPDSQNLVTKISRQFLSDAPTWQEQFDEMEKGYEYLAGVQYTGKRKGWYETQRRPVRTFNILFPIFNQVMGDFILNDTRFRAFAKPGGTAEVASTFEDLLEHYNQENDIKSVFARVGLAGLVKCGYVYPRWSDERYLDGSLVIGDIDEFQVMFDTTAIENLIDDGWYLLRSSWMTLDQMKHYWPHHRRFLEEQLQDIHDVGFSGSLNEFMALNMMNPEFVNEMSGKYRVIEFHEMEYKRSEVAYDTLNDSAEIFALEGQKADFFLKTHPQVKIIQRNAKFKEISSCVPGLNFLLDSKPADIQDGSFDIVPFFAYNYGKRTIKNFGIFKNSQAPQDDFNDWRNTLADTMNKVADPGHTYNPHLIENPQDIENYGRMPGLNIKVKQAVQRIEDAIKRNDIPTLPFAPDQMSQEAADFLMKITGVTPNKMGVQETANENASLFAQRVRQAQVSMMVMFSNWQKTKKRLYEKAIRLIQENLTNEKYFLITNPKKGDQKEVWVNAQIGNQILNQLNPGRYGVIVDDVESNPSARMVRFMEKSQVIDKVITLFGGAMVNPNVIASILQWWLEESNLGDIDKFLQSFIQGLQQDQQMATEQMEQAEAFGATEKILQLAKQKQDLYGLTESNENSPVPEGSAKK